VAESPRDFQNMQCPTTCSQKLHFPYLLPVTRWFCPWFQIRVIPGQVITKKWTTPPQISMKLGTYIPYQKLLIHTHIWALMLYGFWVTTF